MAENTIKKLVALANSTVDEDGLERLAVAYTKGWDDAEDAVRREIADVLLRSGRERAELEESVELLMWALKFYAAPENWDEDPCQCCDQALTSKAYCDTGDTARQAFHALGLDEHQKEEGDANS